MPGHLQPTDPLRPETYACRGLRYRRLSLAVADPFVSQVMLELAEELLSKAGTGEAATGSLPKPVRGRLDCGVAE